MAGPFNIGNNLTSSAPNVYGSYLRFRGTDNHVYRLTIAAPDKTTISDRFSSSTTSMRSPDSNVYFQGTDNKLWRYPTK